MALKFPTYELEDRLKEKGFNFVVGVDEVGRGPGAGPVVAGAVRVPEHMVPTMLGKIKDSKKLSPSARETYNVMIRDTCDYGIGIVNNKIVDDINILEATKLAMEKAIRQVSSINYLLIDGTVDLKRNRMRQQNVIKGDSKSLSIAAASIIAKVERDQIMRELHYVYPQYKWNKNKGYLTKEHIAAIRKYGTTEYHRMSFNKVGR